LFTHDGLEDELIFAPQAASLSVLSSTSRVNRRCRAIRGRGQAILFAAGGS
jgi:hypothetical protein